MEVRKGELV